MCRYRLVLNFISTGIILPEPTALGIDGSTEGVGGGGALCYKPEGFGFDTR
jgi:hypothetical protein